MSALGHKRTFAVQTSMSALGQKQTCAAQLGMSALPPKADIRSARAHVRFVPITRTHAPQQQLFDHLVRLRE